MRAVARSLVMKREAVLKVGGWLRDNIWWVCIHIGKEAVGGPIIDHVDLGRNL